MESPEVQEKRNSLRNLLLDLIEKGHQSSEEAAGYEKQFEHLGLTRGDQGFLADLDRHPGYEVIQRVFRMRYDAVDNALKYSVSLSPDEKLDMLSLWRALALCLDDLQHFPKAAAKIVSEPSKIDEGEDDIYG